MKINEVQKWDESICNPILDKLQCACYFLSKESVAAVCRVETESYKEMYVSLSKERKQKVQHKKDGVCQEAYVQQDEWNNEQLTKGEREAIVSGYLLEELLRWYIKQYQKQPKESEEIMEFCYEVSENGKPYLKEYKDVFFSLSHTKDMAAVAISNRPIGIDVEQIKAIKQGLAHRFMGEKEIEWIEKDNERKEERFFRVWTYKEAVTKLRDEKLINVLKSCEEPEKIYQWLEEGNIITVVE